MGGLLPSDYPAGLKAQGTSRGLSPEVGTLDWVGKGEGMQVITSVLQEEAWRPGKEEHF